MDILDNLIDILIALAVFIISAIGKKRNNLFQNPNMINQFSKMI